MNTDNLSKLHALSEIPLISFNTKILSAKRVMKIINLSFKSSFDKQKLWEDAIEMLRVS